MKIRAINKKIEQNKVQDNLDKQIAKVLALSSWNFSKYEFLIGKDVLPKKDLLKKAPKIKRFEYRSLGRELKLQIDIAKKQYQKLFDTFKFDKIFKKEKPTIKNYSKSDLVYDSKYSFYNYYRNSKKIITFLLISSICFYSNFLMTSINLKSWKYKK